MKMELRKHQKTNKKSKGLGYDYPSLDLLWKKLLMRRRIARIVHWTTLAWR
ncbi:hypothetical protein SSIN_0083 [Streptococcus sinensis]|uniref:Uncharacterized protein n=1 Tax=Streptococcus sinensis TaxID=176090 RepID=A0A0A0DJD2_9STRE|nr:hypothetical protein SSIN_0083 [Streptococcus sinensis]